MDLPDQSLVAVGVLGRQRQRSLPLTRVHRVPDSRRRKPELAHHCCRQLLGLDPVERHLVGDGRRRRLARHPVRVLPPPRRPVHVDGRLRVVASHKVLFRRRAPALRLELLRQANQAVHALGVVRIAREREKVGAKLDDRVEPREDQVVVQPVVLVQHGGLDDELEQVLLQLDGLGLAVHARRHGPHHVKDAHGRRVLVQQALQVGPARARHRRTARQLLLNPHAQAAALGARLDGNRRGIQPDIGHEGNPPRVRLNRRRRCIARRLAVARNDERHRVQLVGQRLDRADLHAVAEPALANKLCGIPSSVAGGDGGRGRVASVYL